MKNEIKYDKVTHYKLKYNFNELNFRDQQNYSILSSSHDSLYINKYWDLGKIGYIKIGNGRINPIDVSQLKTENFIPNNYCISLYEEIFVFSLNNKIKAVVKFDFQCRKTSIIINENNKVKNIFLNNIDLYKSIFVKE